MFDSHSMHFRLRRISAVISKLVQSLPDTKRDATEMTASLMNALVQDEAHSTAAATGIWHRLSFIPQLKDEMADDPQSVLDKLSAIRDICECRFPDQFGKLTVDVTQWLIRRTFDSPSRATSLRSTGHRDVGLTTLSRRL
jgi:hypothetical protein